ncbi:hypothetical protein Tco_0704502 [Tanacetum coccineum]|uniref:Reverse transcriptase Ty1/copia-type domain-containing protein n=1 Tax=Tanacetum coccineum TaxID=301880 RepID=A0ABQ4Y2R9_9ASTR
MMRDTRSHHPCQHEIPKGAYGCILVKKKDDGIFISQDKYVADILKKFDFATNQMIGSFDDTLKGPTKLGLWYPSEKNLVFHSKTKHIEIRHNFIRDSYEKKLIQVIKIHTDHNVADLLTKAFDVSRLDERECNIKQKWVKGQDNPLIPNTHPHLLNSLLKNQSLFYHHLNLKRPTNLGKPKRTTKISQSSGPLHLVADETIIKEWKDRMEMDATIASSLEAEQDSGNINRTQYMATLNESFP